VEWEWATKPITNLINKKAVPNWSSLFCWVDPSVGKFLSAGIIEAMRALKTFIPKPVFWLLFVTFLFSSCSQPIEMTPVVEESPSPTQPTLIPTPEQPTSIPQSAAAVVNGEVIPLTWFEREVARYLIPQSDAENGDIDEQAAREMVLNDLIDQFLLAQAAREAGTVISDEDIRERIDALGEAVDLNAWMTTWGYTLEELVESLRLQMLVAHQRDRITESVPDTVEQVELRQVFAFTEAGANRALLNLNSGANFEDLAFEFSPETGGYLGWVPRGYLLIPAVEEAVFNQPVGTYTEIIESEIGYHIVLVINREERALSPDARLTLARQALNAWMEDRRAVSTVEILVE
jgi:peptidyl-prolyl cis-trans isomerase C